MNPLTFFREEPVRRALERAARCAGTPLSLHFVDHGEEGPRILGWGACAACSQVAALPEGPTQCRNDRLTGSEAAIRHGGPLPFFCHMGFTCLAAPALPAQRFVLTFGPYCPAEEPRALEYQAQRGWESLTQEAVESLPFSLDDIHRAPAASIPAIAEWTLDVLAALWVDRHAEEDLPEQTPAPGEPMEKGNTRRKPPAKGDLGSEIALALINGNPPLARDLFRGALEEMHTGKRMRIGLLRARTIHLIGAVLESVERAGEDASQGWRLLGALAEEIAAAGQERDLIDAALRLLGKMKREPGKKRANGKQKAPKPPVQPPGVPELTRIIEKHLVEGIRLEEAAALLGETPTAISHRLRRKFGMSFSEYVNRLRIDRAKDLLRRTQLNATQIAQRLGISDQSNFGKLFKRFEGITPLEYRERFGKNR